MGCFNVACSVSKISINHGDAVVFVPLLPVFYNRKTDGLDRPLSPEKHLSSFNHYFQQFCLPIYAVYNDYGGVESVREDANTEAIEKFLGVKIEDLVDSIGTSRSYASYFWPLHEHFVTNHAIFKDYNRKFDELFLIDMGFSKEADERFVIDKSSYSVKLLDVDPKRKTQGYQILNKDLTVVEEVSSENCWDGKETFFAKFSKLSNYFIGVPEDKQKSLEIILELSGMFIHQDIYEMMINKNQLINSAQPTPHILSLLGFHEIKDDPEHGKSHGYKIFSHSGNEKMFVKSADRYYASFCDEEGKRTAGLSFQGMPDFIKKVKDTFNVELDPVVLESDSRFSPDFEIARADEEKFKPMKQLTAEEIAILSPQISKEQLEMLMNPPKFNFSPLGGYFGKHCSFGVNCGFMVEIYRESILSGTIKKALLDWWGAQFSLMSNNVLLFPAMNGLQYGDHESTKELLLKSLEIVNTKIEKYKEDEDE